MMYEEVIRDFAQRTLINLTVIETLEHDGKDVFEVTQLVNSCLGLLVFPQQEFVDRIPKTPLSELVREGWPIPKIVGDFVQATDLNQLVRFLRNAITHYGIKFNGDGQNRISLLTVWNIDSRSDRKTWQAELSVSDLRKFALKISGLLINFEMSE